MDGKAAKILNSAAAFIAIYFESYSQISLSNITAAHDTDAQFQIDTVTSFRNRIKRYTLSKRLHENDLSVFSAVTSWPRHVLLQRCGDDYTLKRRHFVLEMAKRKDIRDFVQTDDEVRLLLRIKNSYKVAKSVEHDDCRVVRTSKLQRDI